MYIFQLAWFQIRMSCASYIQSSSDLCELVSWYIQYQFYYYLPGKLVYIRSFSQPGKPNVELHWLVSIELEIVLKSGINRNAEISFQLIEHTRVKAKY